MRSQTAKQKKTESYPVVLSDLLDIREEGKKTTQITKRLKQQKIRAKKNTLFYSKQRVTQATDIKNLSNTQLTAETCELNTRISICVTHQASRKALLRLLRTNSSQENMSNFKTPCRIEVTQLEL